VIKHVIAATSLVLVAGSALAGEAGSMARSSGYQNCVNAVSQDTRYLRVEPKYFTHSRDESRTYYMNAVGHRSDVSGPFRIACETTTSGHKVLSVKVDGGRYVGRLVDPTGFAAN
jgi:hypothetical protein